MASILPRVVVLGLLLIGGLFGYKMIRDGSPETQYNASLQAEIAAQKQKNEQLQREKQELQLKNDALAGIVKRLQTDKRVAHIVVIGQKTDEKGKVLDTTIQFTEYARDGKQLLRNARQFTIQGAGIHLDAYVIQFEGKYVEQNDPLKGHSVAMFHRLFGDDQTPNDGFILDSPGEAPDFYQGADPRLAAMEKELWKDFWRLVDEPAYREKFGVKLAYGSSAFDEKLKKGRVYTVTLDPQGGLKMASN